MRRFGSCRDIPGAALFRAKGVEQGHVRTNSPKEVILRVTSAQYRQVTSEWSVFPDIPFLLARFAPGNDLHRAIRSAFGKVFGDRVTAHPIEMTRAVEHSGRFLSSLYDTDHRDMTRDTCRRARASFDQAHDEFKGHALVVWDTLEG